MSPIPRAALTLWDKVRTNKILLLYIAIVVTIILYLSVATRYFPGAP